MDKNSAYCFVLKSESHEHIKWKHGKKSEVMFWHLDLPQQAYRNKYQRPLWIGIKENLTMSAKHVLTGRHGLTLQNSTLLGVHVVLDGQHV